MSKITTVLFDLGNVLAYIDFNAFWRTLGFLQMEEIAPFGEGYKSWTLKYETGLISTDEYLKALQLVFGYRFEIKQLEEAFTRIMLEPIEGMSNLVERISNSRRTALVSNTNDIHYRLSLKKYKVLQLLPKHYLSYQLCIMKPAKEFYEAIIRDQGMDPSELFFIDDIAANVEGALLSGMQGVRFENITQLEMVLKDLEVIP